MSDLLKLADRCEAADSPSFDLDKAILAALGFTWRGMDYWSADDKHIWKKPATFTHSIDAALGLIPEGFQWKCGYSRHVPHQAELIDYASHSGRYDGNSDHSRALAICAAALRARASIAVGGARSPGDPA